MAYICFVQMLPQKSTIGVLNPPLGNTRLQTIHLITAIIEANDVKMNQELVKLNTLSILLVRVRHLLLCQKASTFFHRNYFFTTPGIIFFMPK